MKNLLERLVPEARENLAEVMLTHPDAHQMLVDELCEVHNYFDLRYRTIYTLDLFGVIDIEHVSRSFETIEI